MARVRIEDLPAVELRAGLLTAICDPEPIQIDPDAGDTTVFCNDAVALGLRVATAVTAGPITRIYVRRPTCAATPCSVDELSTATAVAWGVGGAVSIAIDSRLDTVAPPERVALASWPLPATLPAPEASSEAFDAAPREISARRPYPSCGRATYDAPKEVLACFRDSVLLGRPAEAVIASFGTEGGEVLDIVRFAGEGALTRYRKADGRWVRQNGSLVLDPPAGSWAFAAWDAGEPVK